VAIVGGGLAGLALSIQLARQGHSVIVFEKEQYPFHRVCGEYISLESWDFLTGLGIDLAGMNVPIIKKLQVSAVNGKSLEQRLPLGGFGISRYVLDFALASLAKAAGVTVEENTKVNDISFDNTHFSVHTSGQVVKARIAAGSFGKRSNIDIKWKRPFAGAAKNKLNNYIGVKYHIRADFPADTIALHTFDHGYCGVVKIGSDKYNLCYLTTAANLQKSGGSVAEMERVILSANPHLRELLSHSEKYEAEPVTISQVSFDRKSQVEQHVLMIGDAAGMIAPLCGNGMSMALHASKIAGSVMHPFLQDKISRAMMERRYQLQWRRMFGARLRMGRMIQRLSGNALLMRWFISAGKTFPALMRGLIRQTHGQAF
jgi:flavin-dependent dehydrogenase